MNCISESSVQIVNSCYLNKQNLFDDIIAISMFIFISEPLNIWILNSLFLVGMKFAREVKMKNI